MGARPTIVACTVVIVIVVVWISMVEAHDVVAMCSLPTMAACAGLMAMIGVWLTTIVANDVVAMGTCPTMETSAEVVMRIAMCTLDGVAMCSCPAVDTSAMAACAIGFVMAPMAPIVPIDQCATVVACLKIMILQYVMFLKRITIGLLFEQVLFMI